MRTVICRVHGQDVVHNVTRQLHDGGFAPGSIEVQGVLKTTWRSVLWQCSLWPFLIRLRWGDTLIIVRTADEHAQRAVTILEAAGGADINVRPAREHHIH